MTDALKGHTMKRGTLMVLKRILVTALGALGLGALAAGTASGQTAGEGNIPAPDIFDDQITCSMNVPTMNPMPTQVPMGAMTSPLDDIIGMGTTELNTTVLTDADDQQTLMDLGYVIPPTGANCGLGAPAAGADAATLGMQASFVDGYDENDDGMYDGANDAAPKNAIPADVAAGYSVLLDRFVAVYGDPGGTTGGTKRALEAAEKALADELKKDSPNQTLVTQLTDARDDANTAHTKAMAAFNAASGGPIYQAGVAEWMAKAAVTKSVMDYNSQVVKTNMALTDLNAMTYAEYDDAGTAGRSKYVPLGNTELWDNGNATTVVSITAGMGTVNVNQLIQYTNSDLNTPQVGTPGMAGMGSGDGSAGNDAPVASDTAQSNFTATGQLIIPMEPNTDTADDGTDLRTAVNTTNTVNDIRTTVENVRIAAAAIKKARDEYVGTQQDIYDEAHRRAQLELNYYEALWAQVLADTEDTRTTAQRLTFVDDNTNGVRDEGEADNADYEANPITIASRNAGYISESNKRVAAEQDLRSKVSAREMATAEVVKQFTAPQAFYSQLVSRREALKAAADKVVADAETPTDAQTMAQADALKALTEAQTKKAEFDALFADPDDPKVALINELVKTGGDDGQALADAISSNYSTANDAKTRADEVAESVAGLTGEGGAVAMNTANIESLDGRVSQNEEDIATNTTMIGENRGMIMTNAENIATNATNIATNTTMIGENRGMIMTNADNIMTNAGHITENRGMIETNAANISSNADAIASNMNSIGQNSSAISDNRNMIGELSDDLDVVRAGVAASMALAGMPAINGRGISIGVGSYDGESAFAVGFQIQGEMASFKVGVTSAGGETGASAGVGFQF